MIYYTADLHLGYEPILNQRPFRTVEEMDRTLIDNWNQIVTDRDTVYIVGDFSYNNGHVPHQYFSQLNGIKHLIRGNHDTPLENAKELYKYCASVVDFWELEDGEHHILLSHYPMIYDKGGYMIHGHLHAYRSKAYELLRQLPRVLNCGVDVNHYRPVTLQELIRNNELFYSENSTDHFPICNKPSTSQAGKLPRRPDFRPLPER